MPPYNAELWGRHVYANLPMYLHLIPPFLDMLVVRSLYRAESAASALTLLFGALAEYKQLVDELRKVDLVLGGLEDLDETDTPLQPGLIAFLEK